MALFRQLIDPLLTMEGLVLPYYGRDGPQTASGCFTCLLWKMLLLLLPHGRARADGATSASKTTNFLSISSHPAFESTILRPGRAEHVALLSGRRPQVTLPQVISRV